MTHELVIPSSTLETGLALLIAGAPVMGQAVVGPLHQWNAGGRSVWSATTLRSVGTGAAWPVSASRPASSSRGWLGVQWLGHSDASALSSAAWLDRVASLRQLQPEAQRGQTLLLLLVDESGQLAGRLATVHGIQPLGMIRLPGPGMVQLALKRPAADLSDTDLAEGRYSRLAGANGVPVLRNLQGTAFVLVGGGRVGSYISHTLVRAGASLDIIDPDLIELHNASDSDGLVPSIHEGHYKCSALARVLKPLARPGARVEGHRLGVGSRAAARLIASKHLLISAVDNPSGRFLASLWALASQLPHLDIGVGMPLEGGAGVDVRLILPPDGCLHCQGGYTDYEHLLAGVLDPAAVPPDFRLRRRGSARSIGVVAANLGMRLIEQLFEGRISEHRFVQLREDGQTGEWRLRDAGPQRRGTCTVCGSVAGVGVEAIDRGLMVSLAAQAARQHGVGK